MSEKQGKGPHSCQCAKCVASSSAVTAQLHQQINQLAARLNEKDRRQFVGLLARQLGRGGVTLMAEVTGLNRNTIMRGQRELVDSEFSERVRRKGGGRSTVEKKGQTC